LFIITAFPSRAIAATLEFYKEDHIFMKKNLQKAIALCITASLVFPVAFANTTTEVTPFNQSLDHLNSPKTLEITDIRFNTEINSGSKVNTESEAINFLLQTKQPTEAVMARSVFSPSRKGFSMIDSFKDNLGTTHFKMAQTYDGIEIYGNDVALHSDPNGNVYAVNNTLTTYDLDSVQTNGFAVDGKKAISLGIASLNLEKESFTAKPTSKLYLYSINEKLTPVYLVTVQFIEPYPANMQLFVDAFSGEIIDSYNASTDVQGSGTGDSGIQHTFEVTEDNGQYVLKDSVRNITTHDGGNGEVLPGSVVASNTTTFDNSRHGAAVDAHKHLEYTYDFFMDEYYLNSFDGRAAAINATVHHRENYNNAFWNGSQMVFGDGDGKVFDSFAASLDIVAHEFTHAVTTHSSGLEYRNQSGALNESMSDIFGVLIENEFYKDPAWWEMGEDAFLLSPGGLRDMRNPELHNQPAHMDDYLVTLDDNGGVHTNSGIPNKAFYLIAKEIGLEKAGKIFYRANSAYLLKTASFLDCKNAVAQSAADLYGLSERAIVEKAFTDVGVTGASAIENLKSAEITASHLKTGSTFEIKIDVPSDNSAVFAILYENEYDNPVLEQPLTPNHGEAVTLTKEYPTKAPGVYYYHAVLFDGARYIGSNIIGVEVKGDNAPWDVDTYYTYDDTITYEGNTYKCQIAHQSQSDWLPNLTPALWVKQK